MHGDTVLSVCATSMQVSVLTVLVMDVGPALVELCVLGAGACEVNKVGSPSDLIMVVISHFRCCLLLLIIMMLLLCAGYWIDAETDPHGVEACRPPQVSMASQCMLPLCSALIQCVLMLNSTIVALDGMFQRALHCVVTVTMAPLVPHVNQVISWNLLGMLAACPFTGMFHTCFASRLCVMCYRCEKCPPSKGSMAAKVFAFFAVIAGLFVAGFVIILLATKRRGGSVSQSIFRTRDFVGWTMITWQVGFVASRSLSANPMHSIPDVYVQTIIQVGKRSASAPPALQRFYAVISIMELDTTGTCPAECVPVCF